jgi:hypothetical protein
VGVTVALINFIYYIGMATGAPVVTGVVDASGGSWLPAVVPLVAVSALGALAAIIFQVVSRKKA